MVKNFFFIRRCKIVENLLIGKKCQIGPNVVMCDDVHDNTTVVFEKNVYKMIEYV